MKLLSLIGLSLMAIGVLIVSHASCYQYGKSTGRNESTTLKTESVFKPRRYFVVTIEHGDTKETIWLSTANGEHYQYEYLKNKFKTGPAVVLFSHELTESDYNQFIKK